MNSEKKIQPVSENIIYIIIFADQETNPVVFRIHRPGYHNPEEVRSELIWMEEIANDTDVKVPVVYRGRNHEILQKIEDKEGRSWWCSVISFLKGKLLILMTADMAFLCMIWGAHLLRAPGIWKN